jgi:hypothetical protein
MNCCEVSLCSCVIPNSCTCVCPKRIFHVFTSNTHVVYNLSIGVTLKGVKFVRLEIVVLGIDTEY